MVKNNFESMFNDIDAKFLFRGSFAEGEDVQFVELRHRFELPEDVAKTLPEQLSLEEQSYLIDLATRKTREHFQGKHPEAEIRLVQIQRTKNGHDVVMRLESKKPFI